VPLAAVAALPDLRRLTVRVERAGDLDDPALVALVTGHVAELRAVSPPGTSYALDSSLLRDPAVTMWVARDDDGLLGCVALQELEPGHGEVKSMRTATHARRRGVGSALLTAVVAEARERGMTRLSLETGTSEFFRPARELYARHGFEPGPAFGSYVAGPDNTFFTRVL
jgi:putative acetyltransferase